MAETIKDGDVIGHYRERAQILSERFDKLDRGARALAAKDLRVSAASVSNALTGQQVMPALLVRLRAWLDAQTENTGKGE